MHLLNLHHGRCEQQQNDGDDNMVCIVASKDIRETLPIHFDSVWAPSINVINTQSTAVLHSWLRIGSATAWSEMWCGQVSVGTTISDFTFFSIAVLSCVLTAPAISQGPPSIQAGLAFGSCSKSLQPWGGQAGQDGWKTQRAICCSWSKSPAFFSKADGSISAISNVCFRNTAVKTVKFQLKSQKCSMIWWNYWSHIHLPLYVCNVCVCVCVCVYIYIYIYRHTYIHTYKSIM